MRRLSSRTASALLAVALLTHCASKPKPLPPQVSTSEAIVAKNASDAFVTFLDAKADRANIRAFADRIAGAKTRQALATAWNQIPSLAALAESLDEWRGAEGSR